jgi:uncharacterized protein (TIGR02217 family)
MSVTYLFDEILLDPNIFTAGGGSGGPQYANTLIKNPATGIYKVNVTRYDFQHVWDFHTDLLTPAKLDYFVEFWGGGQGSAYGFRAVIHADFYVIDEVIGTGDGVTAVFPLYRTYKRPGASHSYIRRIIKPVVNALLSGGGVALYEYDGATARVIPSTRATGVGVPAFTVKKNGVTTTAYTVDNTTGKITFSAAPANGVVISWSGEYDTPVRFMQNQFSLKPDVSSDIQGLQLCEILPAELGIT